MALMQSSSGTASSRRTRNTCKQGRPIGLLTFFLIIFTAGALMADSSPIARPTIDSLIQELTGEYGSQEQDRISRCVEQTARLWRTADGDVEAFKAFCLDNYIADPELRQKTAQRFENVLADLFGHYREMGRQLSWHVDVATGPILPIDRLLARYSPSSHFDDDMFESRIAFAALVNFPIYTLDEKLTLGPDWTREEWMQARIADIFATRVPAEVSQKLTEAYVDADSYISDYNIYMHHLLTPDGSRLFPEGLRLISHWNLRDELKAQYSEPDGLPRQQMIYDVMLKIVRQEIPAVVVNNPAVDWQVGENVVVVSPTQDGELPENWDVTLEPGHGLPADREPDTRYARWQGIFHAQQLADPYYPTMPTLIDRRFQANRAMPEQEVESLLVSICESETVAGVGRLIAQRLGRPLQPFDIWYDGFKQRGAISEETLDSVVNERYPTVQAFTDDFPRILAELGFDSDKIAFLTQRIDVDPSRGAGHAAAPGRKADKAHLRTRVPESGMNYKGYNIAIHELGHNVEQVFSLNRIDHPLLRGVPNTAFTEAFAFVFQAKDLELLGLAKQDEMAEHLKTLDVLWSTYEIGGVSLVDMRAWRWLYEHPEANAAEFKDGVLAIARDVWNQYFAPVFGTRDCEILAIYSHMIDAGLYLPDYPIGHIIAFQIEDYLKGRVLGEEMERMCRLGRITPDLWMRQAVGAPVSTEPLLQASEEALSALAG